MVAVDPLASLGIDDITITIGGVDYLMEGRPAADWLERMIEHDLIPILPGWLDEEAEAVVLDDLMENRVTSDELDALTREAITFAAGRPWWWAQSLINYMASDVHHWSRINGALVLAGVDPSRISLSSWIDAVYATVTARLQGDEYTNFKAQVDTPPTPDLLDEEEESEAFLSMLD